MQLCRKWHHWELSSLISLLRAATALRQSPTEGEMEIGKAFPPGRLEALRWGFLVI